jgi:hypothetical protein
MYYLDHRYNKKIAKGRSFAFFYTDLEMILASHKMGGQTNGYDILGDHRFGKTYPLIPLSTQVNCYWKISFNSQGDYIGKEFLRSESHPNKFVVIFSKKDYEQK